MPEAISWTSSDVERSCPSERTKIWPAAEGCVIQRLISSTRLSSASRLRAFWIDPKGRGNPDRTSRTSRTSSTSTTATNPTSNPAKNHQSEDNIASFLCAHRLKNMFVGVQADKTNRVQSSFKGTSSSRALRGFYISMYLQKQNGRIGFLTATPFSNTPLEVYTMLCFLGYNELCKNNLNKSRTWVRAG